MRFPFALRFRFSPGVRYYLLGLSLVAFLMSSFLLRKKDPAQIQEMKVQLGRELFFDKTLSDPDGQSCTVCHAPKTMFSDPNHEAVTEGMISGFFVNRNSQSLAYVSFIPPLKYDEAKGYWRGGLFWDGRSNSLEHQLSGPFFNMAEMNNADTASLMQDVRKANYFKSFRHVYGKAKNDTVLFGQMVDAIAAFERTAFFNEFSSKYDYFQRGEVMLTDEEKRGLELFAEKANCDVCHSMEPQGEQGRVMFTDYGYHNLGIPRNEKNPFYTTDTLVNPLGYAAIDLGLGAVLNDPKQHGKFRTPTLRNLEFTAPYFHNGGFQTIEEVVHFMNTRNGGSYPEPEVRENIEYQRMGHLMLSTEEEKAIVAFLRTLKDGYKPE